jgi:transcriptional regulator with XRE-family HTH domain
VSNNVALLRKKKGLSQEKLAELLGCSRQTITRWETGSREPRVSDLLKIASVLDCTIEDLINISNPTKSAGAKKTTRDSN